LRPDLSAFERSDTCERRPGRKTLDQQAKLGDIVVKWHDTWGMSVYVVPFWHLFRKVYANRKTIVVEKFLTHQRNIGLF